MTGSRGLAVAALLLLPFAAGTSCGEESAGEGTLAVEIWGEEFIEDGIPAAVFVDGWSVTFDKFLVAVDGVAAARGSAAPDLEDAAQRIFDLTRAGPFPFLTRPVPAGRYDNTAYRLRPAQAAAAAANASAADVTLMTDHGYAIYVSGTATDGTTTKTLHWGFTTDTAYTGCHSEADLADGQSATIQLTIHADHLFYNDLVSEDPDVKFSTIAAADTDADGEVTLAELAAFDITGLADYGTGSLRVDNLADFIAHLTATLGHIDGEGHCHAEAAEH
jgi:hypothetical protein